MATTGLGLFYKGESREENSLHPGMSLFSAVVLLSSAKPLDFSLRPHREKASDEVMRLAALPELTRLCTEASNLTRAYRKSLL